jgi:hypothetical protein
MLVSGNISPNVLPGVIKALEKFILVYGIDEAIRAANMGRGKVAQAAKSAGQIVIQQNRLVAKESFVAEVSPTKPTYKGPPAQKQDEEEKEKKGDKGTKLTKLVTGPGYTSISLEPTWISFESSDGVKLLGLKVVPFMMAKGVDVVAAIKNDMQRKKLEAYMESKKRMIIRLIWRLGRFLRIPFIKDKALTGDPQKDIIWATTLYKKRVFLMLSQVDIEEENLFAKPADVLKLFKMGWSSIVVADDVNKQATFCMKEFGGICSVVPYSYMFASLGKEQLKVYEDLEDARRSAGPFFRMKVPMRKVFGEAIAYEKYKNFSMLNEDVDTVITKLGGDMAKRTLSSLKKVTDPEEIKSKLSFLPTVSMSRIEKYAKKLSPDFKKNYEMSKKVLKNSLDLPSNINDKVALILTVGATHNVAESDKTVKFALLTYVNSMRKAQKNLGDVANTFLKVFLAIIFAALLAIIVDKIRGKIEPVIGDMYKNKIGPLLAKLIDKLWKLSPTTKAALIISITLLILVIVSKES